MAKNQLDEIQTMINVVNSSVLSSMSDKHKVQQIAAGAALFALKICRWHGLDARECALDIPYWIHRILKSPDEAFKNFKAVNQKVSGRGDTVRQNGMDYTSSENIHKVIDPLFLDDLKAELTAIKSMEPPEFRARMLLNFQEKLASLKIFDPAAGCGNFLVETFISLRELENEIIAELVRLGVDFDESQRTTG